jgi:uncharacterized protein YchJ
MHLKLPENARECGVLVLEHGPRAGERFQFKPKVCGNPACNCKVITLACHQDSGSGAGESPEIQLEFNCADRKVVPARPVRDELAAKSLSEAVAAEIQESTWEDLRKFYVGAKRRYTESVNLRTVDADFPPEAGSGATVGYYEILPYAPPIEISLAGQDWLVDDQYCVRPRCDCHYTVLSFLRPRKRNDSASTTEDQDLIALRFDYRTGETETLPQTTRRQPDGTEFVAALQALNPNLNQFIAERHDLLRALYRRALSQRGARSSRKVGRNDPCPCGSGRKYKQCCGRS